jgi:Mrp family chromosome partitioning ATPase
MISREIDQIVLVVKVGQTDKKAFHHTITNLKNINAPIGGIVMNAVTNKTSYGSYYYYYQQYYHYYGK